MPLINIHYTRNKMCLEHFVKSEINNINQLAPPGDIFSISLFYNINNTLYIYTLYVKHYTFIHLCRFDVFINLLWRYEKTSLIQKTVTMKETIHNVEHLSTPVHLKYRTDVPAARASCTVYLKYRTDVPAARASCTVYLKYRQLEQAVRYI